MKKRSLRMKSKAVVFLIIYSFVLPSLTWAFDTCNYQISQLSFSAIHYLGSRIAIPKKAGLIKAGFQGGNKTIIYIEDLHCNYEVQKNIASMIGYLAKRHGLKLVGVEGAFAELNPAVVREFPIRKTRESVSDYFVKQGKLSGAEHIAITGERRIQVAGIEPPELYQASRKAVKSFLNAESQGYVCDLRDILNELKDGIYNPQLLEFDKKRLRYREGKTALIKYAVYLKSQADTWREDINKYPGLERFLDLRQEYFTRDSRPEKIYQELNRLDIAIRRHYYTSKEQQLLDSLYRRLDIIEKLLNISATPEELEQFRSEPKNYTVRQYAGFIRAGQPKREAWPGAEIYALDEYINQAKAFYAMADERSRYFVRNMIDAMENTQQSLAVMISGGFHTDKIIAEMRRQRVSYVAVKPGLTRQDIINPYFRLLQNRSAPLEELLKQNQTALALRAALENPVRRMEMELVLKSLAHTLEPTPKQQTELAGYFRAHNQVTVRSPGPAETKAEGWPELTPVKVLPTSLLRNGEQAVVLIAPQGMFAEESNNQIAPVDSKQIDKHRINVYSSLQKALDAAHNIRQNQKTITASMIKVFTALKTELLSIGRGLYVRGQFNQGVLNATLPIGYLVLIGLAFTGREAGRDTEKTEQEELSEIQDDLIKIRECFSAEEYFRVEPERVERLIERIKAAIGNSDDPDMLSYYYTAKVMLKVAKFHDDMFEKTGGKNSVQILAMNSDMQEVLLQRRGPYKRLFADKYTVSANAKPKPGQSIKAEAAKALGSEVHISAEAERFRQIGKRNSYHNKLCSYDFYALDKDEEKLLAGVYDKLKKKHSSLAGVIIDYSHEKRCLCVYSINPETGQEDVKEIAVQIQKKTKVPYIYPVADDDYNTLLVYQLTKEEETEIRQREQAPDSKNEDYLKILDSDKKEFVSWTELYRDFSENPKKYALDLTGPYFGNTEVWSAILPDTIHADEPLAEEVSISGGKGANTHILRSLSGRITGLNVPDTSILTTFAYERYVLGVQAIRKDIELLDEAKADKDIKKTSKRIRDQILEIKLPEKVTHNINEIFASLGRDIIVRSSSNVEDLKNLTAAGQAESFPHLITEKQAQESVLKVWASLFSDGFVAYRTSNNIKHKDASMAVLLQKYISPQAAGVVFSRHPETKRPVYKYTANPGGGAIVVDGIGTPDTWLVGLNGTEILERWINRKTVKQVDAKEGGTREEAIDKEEPALRDDEILELSQVVKPLHHYYRENNLAQDIDIEFVFDIEGTPYIVQARAQSSSDVEAKEGSVTHRFKAVDEAAVPEDTPRIVLASGSQVAYTGAVTGELQIISKGGPVSARPDAIVVAYHTNNEWNGKFGSLKGVITTDGNPTSHAGQHAQEKRIPCIVGVKGAMETLKEYDGREVTLDTDKGIVYLGAMPIIEKSRSLNMWVTKPGEWEEAESQRRDHELFRKWEKTMENRPKVYLKDFEGQWRRRSNYYGYFELDYYYKAWDRLTKILNDKFKERRPWVLETQEREFKITTRRSFFHRVEVNDPKSIFEFITGVEKMDVKDMQELFDMRWQGFRKMADFMEAIEKIDDNNVVALVDNLVEIFAWMHMGFWLEAIVENTVVNDQLKYIDKEFHDVLRNLAAEDLPRNERIHPYRADIPGGKVLNLTSNKDKEIYALLEDIRSNAKLVEIFSNKDMEVLEENLKKEFAGVYEVIEGWSMKYKSTSEDLARLSDTEEYIRDIHERLMQDNEIGVELLADYYRCYKTEYSKKTLELEHLKRQDGNLHSLIIGYARRIAARRAQGNNWDKLTPERRAWELPKVTEEEWGGELPSAIRALENQLKATQEIRETAKRMLDSFPGLKQTLALSKMQLALREDGHHLVVSFQRKIARMMLAEAKHRKGILKKPENIFQISTDELIALVQEEKPEYISKTFKRWEILDKAERKMNSQWNKNPGKAFAEFELAVKQAIKILQEQAEQTETERVEKSYHAEQERLEHRIKRLREVLSDKTNDRGQKDRQGPGAGGFGGLLSAAVKSSGLMTWLIKRVQGILGQLSNRIANRLLREMTLKQPVNELVSLRSLFGKTQMNVPLFKRHALGENIYKYQETIFGSKFNALDNVRIRVGRSFKVGFEEMLPGVIGVTEELQEKDAAFVITIPVWFNSMLKPAPEKGLLAKLDYYLVSGIVSWQVGRKLRSCAQRLRKVTAEEEVLAQDYLGEKIDRLPVKKLTGFGAPLLGAKYYQPRGGRHLGIAGAELGKLLETYRQAIDTQGNSLWEIIKPQLDSRLKDGHVPSNAEMVQALLQIDKAGIREPLLLQTVTQLVQAVQAAGDSGQDERLRIEVNHVAELIIRSRKGMPIASVNRPITVPENEAGLDQAHLLIDKLTRKVMQQMITSLQGKAQAGTIVQENLKFLAAILSQEALSLGESARLQAMLQGTAMPEGQLAVAPIGEDVSKYAGGMVNGRVDVVENIVVGGQKVEMAKPVIASVLAQSCKLLEVLGTASAQGEVLVVSYQGKLPELIAAQGNFTANMGRYLEKAGYLQERMAPTQALAQAYYRWHAKRSERNHRRMVRVVIRILKHAARAGEKDAGRRVSFDEAMEKINILFRESPIFKKSVILGQIAEDIIYAPRSLSTGGQLGFIWLWQKRSGDFILDNNLEDQLRRLRLRNFRMEGAA